VNNIKVKVEFTIEVNPHAWSLNYGTEQTVSAIRTDVRKHIEHSVHAQFDDLGLTTPAEPDPLTRRKLAPGFYAAGDYRILQITKHHWTVWDVLTTVEPNKGRKFKTLAEAERWCRETATQAQQ
jgi:hypothetical protein